VDAFEGPSAIDQDSLSELSQSVSQVAGVLFSAGSVIDTLASVVELATATIEGCDLAGLLVMDGNGVTTPVFTDPLAREIETAQHRSGEGPSLDAIVHRQMIYADDLRTDLRWPRFSPVAADMGVWSVLSLPLVPAQEGVLNLYGRYPAAFGVVDRAKATILASLASLALSVAHSHEDEERRAENLNAALGTRETIGEALGILMERERITADQAFDILRRASQHLNIKLRDVAQSLVDTGESPDTGPVRAS
jgi:transcriptional regulator with GAF, ATPase, and Fis domain